MKFLFATLLPTLAMGYSLTKTSSLNCREGPSTKYEITKTYLMGDDVKIKCQLHSQRLFGTDIWDKTQDDCFVLDYYLYTGNSQIFTDVCNIVVGDSSASDVEDHSDEPTSEEPSTTSKHHETSFSSSDMESESSELSDSGLDETSSEEEQQTDNTSNGNMLKNTKLTTVIGGGLLLGSAFF